MKEIVFHRSSARTFVFLHMLFHIEHVEQVRLLVAFFISPLKATLHVDTVLSVINQRLYLLSQFEAQGLPSDDSLQIIFHALILPKVEYTLPAIAGLLSETDKSRLDAFFRKAKRRGLCRSDFFHLSTRRQSRSQTLYTNSAQSSLS